MARETITENQQFQRDLESYQRIQQAAGINNRRAELERGVERDSVSRDREYLERSMSRTEVALGQNSICLRVHEHDPEDHPRNQEVVIVTREQAMVIQRDINRMANEHSNRDNVDLAAAVSIALENATSPYNIEHRMSEEDARRDVSEYIQPIAPNQFSQTDIRNYTLYGAIPNTAQELINRQQENPDFDRTNPSNDALSQAEQLLQREAEALRADEGLAAELEQYKQRLKDQDEEDNVIQLFGHTVSSFSR